MQLNYSGLRQSVTSTERASFRERMQNDPAFAAPTTGMRASMTLNAVVAGVIASAFGLSFIWLVDFTIRQLILAPSGGLVWMAIPLAVTGWATYRLALLTARWIGYLHRPWGRWARIAELAHENYLEFIPRTYGAAHITNLFTRGRDQMTSERIIWPNPSIEIGVHRYTDSNLLNRRYRDWHYLVVRLDRNLPHMVLHARANRRAGNLPGDFHRSQVLSLEGDFDRSFTLYAPVTHRSDALYVFTPDLMHLLMTHASAFDVEVIDSVIVFSSPGTADFTDPDAIESLLQVARAVAPTARSRAVRYRDDRTANFSANRVATSGARLRQAAIVTGSVGGALLWGSIQVIRLTAQGIIPAWFATVLLVAGALVLAASVSSLFLAERIAQQLRTVSAGRVRLWAAGAGVASLVAVISAGSILAR